MVGFRLRMDYCESRGYGGRIFMAVASAAAFDVAKVESQTAVNKYFRS